MTAMSQKALHELLAPMDGSFEVFSHDYPFPYSGWHSHPEYEIHLIRKSRGSFYVGTYAGDFEPGNLVMTGPNLPHMWVSTRQDDGADEIVDKISGRDVVVHFSERFAQTCLQSFEDCAPFKTLLDEAHSGIMFSPGTSCRAADLLEDLLHARQLDRLAMFFQLIAEFEADADRQRLSFSPPPDQSKMAGRLNGILAYIAENYSRSDLTCASIATVHDMAAPALSQVFERHISCTCVEYINRLRVYKACQLLAETKDSITSIGYDVGYDTLSTFNRNFLRFIGTTPSEFRGRRNFGLRNHTRLYAEQGEAEFGGALLADGLRAMTLLKDRP